MAYTKKEEKRGKRNEIELWNDKIERGKNRDTKRW